VDIFPLIGGYSTRPEPGHSAKKAFSCKLISGIDEGCERFAQKNRENFYGGGILTSLFLHGKVLQRAFGGEET
jgi:hypothetical protein